MSKEILQIIEKLNALAPEEKAILATVVDVQGSGYRRPGARMLIDRNGYGVGTVSGGCLEADVLERAKKVLETGEPTVITYDTTKDENSVFGLGMGCRGIVRILLEPIDKNNHFVSYFSDVLKKRQTCRIKTLISTTSPELKIGARVFDVTPLADNFSSDQLQEIKNLPEKSLSVETRSFGEFFVETIKPPLELKIFGAGFDALPLIKFAKELGWRVSVIDHRAGYANAERLPEANEIFVNKIEDLDSAFFEDENTVAVVMTHNYDRDREILRRLLSSNFLYIGALGPKKRAEKILSEIGGNFTEQQLSRLHAPIGLDIGAETPEAIALAIVAEIQAVLTGRDGGFLRNRIGSIYGRSE